MEASQQKAQKGSGNAVLRLEERREAGERAIRGAQSMGKVIWDVEQVAAAGDRADPHPYIILKTCVLALRDDRAMDKVVWYAESVVFTRQEAASALITSTPILARC